MNNQASLGSQLFREFQVLLDSCGSQHGSNVHDRTLSLDRTLQNFLLLFVYILFFFFLATEIYVH